jgi:HEAT repeat protein
MPRLLLFCLLSTSISFGQSPATPPDLPSLIRNLPEAAAHHNPDGFVSLSEALAKTPLADLQANLPALIALTESPNELVRSFAVLSLAGLSEQPGPGGDSQRRQLLVPYLPRLAPRLLDPATEASAYFVFNSIASLRPPPAELLPILIRALDDPKSIQPLPSPNNPQGQVIGPGIAAILLIAGASYHADPVTHITEGSSLPEAQQAVRRFLHRSDRTATSIAQTIRTIALAQPQNPEINDDLARFLDSSEPVVRMALLTNLPRITFSPATFAATKTHLVQLASDPFSVIRIPHCSQHDHCLLG